MELPNFIHVPRRDYLVSKIEQDLSSNYFWTGKINRERIKERGWDGMEISEKFTAAIRENKENKEKRMCSLVQNIFQKRRENIYISIRMDGRR